MLLPPLCRIKLQACISAVQLCTYSCTRVRIHVFGTGIVISSICSTDTSYQHFTCFLFMSHHFIFEVRLIEIASLKLVSRYWYSTVNTELMTAAWLWEIESWFCTSCQLFWLSIGKASPATTKCTHSYMHDGLK
jgi:hypothetical protein